MGSKTWQPGDDKPRAPRAEKKRDVELHDGQPTAPPASPHRPNWRAPEDWREAAMASQRGEINNAVEAQKILDMLNSMSSGTPIVPRAVVQPPPIPRPSPPPTSPTPARTASPSTSRPDDAEDCDCVVLNLGQAADPDCAKCGGNGYTVP